MDDFIICHSHRFLRCHIIHVNRTQLGEHNRAVTFVWVVRCSVFLDDISYYNIRNGRYLATKVQSTQRAAGLMEQRKNNFRSLYQSLWLWNNNMCGCMFSQWRLFYNPAKSQLQGSLIPPIHLLGGWFKHSQQSSLYAYQLIFPLIKKRLWQHFVILFILAQSFYLISSIIALFGNF